MRSSMYFCFVIVSLAICLPASLRADEIQYQVQTTASGSLDGVQFNNDLITVSAVGDTENVVTEGSVNFLLQDIFVTVDIEGLGSATFVDELQAVSNNNSELAGFGNTSTGSGVIFVFDDAFETYDLRSEIGPITSTAVINSGSHLTDAGNLFLIGSNVSGTFSASLTAIPEPGCTVVLTCLAFGFLGRGKRNGTAE